MNLRLLAVTVVFLCSFGQVRTSSAQIGTDWQLRSPAPGHAVSAVAFHPTDQDEIAVIAAPPTGGLLVPDHEGDLFISSDGGLTWALEPEVDQPVTEIHYAADGTLFAGRRVTIGMNFSRDVLMKRTPAGWVGTGPLAIWFLARFSCTGIATDPNVPDRLFVSTIQRDVSSFERFDVWRSDDAGATWQSVRESSTPGLGGTIDERNDLVVVSPSSGPGTEPYVAYSFYVGNGGFPTPTYLYASPNGGATWAEVTVAEDFLGQIFRVTAGRTSPGRLYRAFLDDPSLPAVWSVSDDAGATWTNTGNLGTVAVDGLAASKLESGVLYTSTRTRVHRWTYDGAVSEPLTGPSGATGVVWGIAAGGVTEEIVAAYGRDGVWLRRIPLTVGEDVCGPPVPSSSTGISQQMRLTGSASVSANALTLEARRLPASTFCLAIVGDQADLVTNVGGGIGTLCVGGAIGRYNAQTQDSGPGGEISIALDLAAVPRPNTFAVVAAGQTYLFQCWFRDELPSGAQTSNLTNAVQVTFLP